MAISSFDGKTIVLGVTGSIAVYKTLDWVRVLKAAGAEVHVIMTEAACRFVGPLSFAALSGNMVHTDMFDAASAHRIPHINLARQADLILLAPATARTIGKLAGGLAEDLLSTVIMAADSPVVICPAMNSKMLGHPATQENLKKLADWKYTIIHGDPGLMACGEEGTGRLAEWEIVREALHAVFTPQNLSGKRILITAGPTREPLDPARFISNPSTGKMGFAMASAARRRGAEVTLITGPTQTPYPAGMNVVSINTAADMRREVLARASSADIIVMSAAVCDHRPAAYADQKIKKSDFADSIALAANPDILKELGDLKSQGNLTAALIGFAAESRQMEKEGKRKLREKNLDFIVVNDISGGKTGFAHDTNQILLLSRAGEKIEFPLLSKEETAGRIWDSVTHLSSTV